MRQFAIVFCVFFFLLVFLIFLSNNKGYEQGDIVYATRDVDLVDYESPTIFKPLKCHILKGERVEVISNVVYSMGSGDNLEVLWVREPNTQCFGASPKSHFKPVK